MHGQQRIASLEAVDLINWPVDHLHRQLGGYLAGHLRFGSRTTMFLRTALCRLRSFPFIALLIANCNAAADPFPSADALQWHEFATVHVKIRTPQGWAYDTKSSDDTQAFFVSRTPIAKDAPFQSGISLNVVSFPKDIPQGSLDYAKSFAITYPKKFGEGAECGWKAGTPLNLFWCQANIDEGGHATTALHHLVANADTGKLYVFMFETLREDWQQSWPTISTMLKSISVDPTY